MKMKLFNYVILHHPVDGKSSIIKGVDTILAANEEQAKILLAREIPAKYLDKLSEVETLIRPF